MGSDKNALGYGTANPYWPPLKDFKQLNSWIERKIAITFGPWPNPFHWLAYYLQGFATSDSNDFLFYANALAAGHQVYPSGVHLFFDMYSTWGYLDYCWNWFLNLCFNVASVFTFLIPVDFVIALFTTSWEPLFQNILFYTPFLNWFTFPFMFVWCNVFTCPIEGGWTYQWFSH